MNKASSVRPPTQGDRKSVSVDRPDVSLAGAGAVFLSLFVAVTSLLLPGRLDAHESWPALLEIREQADDRYDVLWRTPFTGGRPSPIQLELPSSWERLGVPTERQQDNWVIQRFSIRPDEEGIDAKIIRFPYQQTTITDIYVRLYRQDGSMFSTVVRPIEPSVTLRGERSFWANMRQFTWLGFHHILLGIDHLCFVLGLLLIVKGKMRLVKTITAFTVAHSLTLAAATLGWVHLPLEPLNAAVALSILFLAPEIVRAWRSQTSLTLQHPWVVAFAFGLLHGVGFATGLSTTGMPASELPWALLWFNVGVELGQLSFLAVFFLHAAAVRRLDIQWPTWALRIPGYAVGCFGAFWTIDRVVAMLNA